MQLTKEDIQRGREAEERNEAMNMMNSAQKANSKAFNEGYDQIRWGEVKTFEYYAYLHVNGSIHVKRYREELQVGYRRGQCFPGDMDEAIESPNVSKVVGPFEAEGRTDALLKARELIKND
jgi:hypothetical protein